jgi:RHS repeat-associated protein
MYLAINNKYPTFGSPMSNRSFNASSSRYGFNGKEKDDETNVAGGSLDYGARMYDSRLAKFLSIDPLTNKFAFYTPYQFAGNKPISAIDLDGLEEYLVIRWYDPLDESKYIGSDVLYIVNSNDRKLGSTGTLYLHLTKSSENESIAKSFESASLHGTQDGNNKTFSTAAKRANILDIDNKLVVNSDYVYTNESTPSNTREKSAASWVKKQVSKEMKKGSAIFGTAFVKAPIYILGFDKNSSKYKPNNTIVDNEGATHTNENDLQAAIKYLNDNPTTEANVVGNASLETTTVDNTKLAKDRASTGAKELGKAGIDNSRIKKSESYSSGGSTADNPNDRSTTIQPNIKRPQ